MALPRTEVQAHELDQLRGFLAEASPEDLRAALTALPLSFQGELCARLSAAEELRSLEDEKNPEAAPDKESPVKPVSQSPHDAVDYWKSVYSYAPADDDQAAASAHPSPKSERKVFIVVPSQSVDEKELEKIEGIMHYEERQLFQLLRLKDPNVQVVYITSIPIHPSIVQYYLSLLPGGMSGTGRRLVMMSTFDSTLKPLSKKVLLRPRMQQKIRKIIAKAGPNAETNMISFISTPDEIKLAEALGVPVNHVGEAAFWGTKCGSRRLFRDLDIPHPEGIYHSLHTSEELAEAVMQMYEKNEDIKRLMVKVNEGFSGEGNALLDLRPVFSRFQSYASHFASASGGEAAVRAMKVDAIACEFPHMRFQAEDETWEGFSKRIATHGCIVEVFLEGKNKNSPSVQGIVHKDGKVEVISTHEQVLGGPDGQIFLGCRFPCEIGYRRLLHEYGMKVGERLRDEGAVERFGVDFICVPHAVEGTDEVKWDVQALEINLRTGGTTHPFETLRLLTGGGYNLEKGEFITEKGDVRCYIASDTLQKKKYEGLLPGDLKRIAGLQELWWDKEKQTGAVFHLMGAMSQFGKVGVTCIAPTIDEAKEIFRRTEFLLDEDTCTVPLAPLTNSSGSAVE